MNKRTWFVAIEETCKAYRFANNERAWVYARAIALDLPADRTVLVLGLTPEQVATRLKGYVIVEK